MNTMGFTDWLLAATLLVAAVAVSASLIRLIRQDGYGTTPGPDVRSDWGTTSVPSVPYNSRS